jgi:hypothetical protein
MESQYVKKALDTSADMLTVMEYIKAVDYPINAFMIDRFYHTLGNDQLIYLDDELIQWVGYDAKTAKNRKINFMRLLQNNTLGVDYYEYDNAEYKKFITSLEVLASISNIYPDTTLFDGRGKATIKHLLLTPNCFRNILMQINTPKARQVRSYYITIEQLFKDYIEYQTEFKQIQQGILLQKNEQLRLKAEETTEIIKQELESKQLALASAAEKLAEQDKQLANTRLVSNELLSYKKFITKDESLYVITSKLYAKQGLFKIGKTKSIKPRVSQLNTGHAPGDELFVAAEFKTGNAKHLEDRVHFVLQHHRVINNREFFHLPFPIICRIIEKLNNNLISEQDLMNEATQILYELQNKSFDSIEWDENVVYSDNLLEAPRPVLLLEGATPAPEAVPPAEEVPQVAAEPAPQYFIPELKLTEEAAIALVEVILGKLGPEKIAKLKALNQAIRDSVRPRPAFKAKLWRNLIFSSADKHGIKIQKR